MTRTVFDALDEAAKEIDAAEAWLHAQVEAKGYEVETVKIKRDGRGDWDVWIYVAGAEPFVDPTGKRERYAFCSGSIREAVGKALAAIEAITPRNAYDADFGVAA